MCTAKRALLTLPVRRSSPGPGAASRDDSVGWDDSIRSGELITHPGHLVATSVRRVSDVIAIIAGIAVIATTNVGVPVGPLPWVYIIIYCLWHAIRITMRRSRIRRGRANPIVSASETWQDLHLGRPTTSSSSSTHAITTSTPNDPV